MAEPAQSEYEIDIGPLTVEQLRGLARDTVSQLRKIADDLEQHGVTMERWLIDSIENQLCG